MTSMPYPYEWTETTLGEIIELKYGKALPATIRDGSGFPVYGSNGVVGLHSAPSVLTGGIVIGRKGSVGEVHKSNGPFSPIDTTYFVDELREQPVSYWFYFLKSLPLTELNRSTAIPGLNREDAYSLSIGLPPLAEQKHIAVKLDELLAQVDTTKARLDAIPKILKRFRQSVLAAAVSGRLTEEWRESADYTKGFPSDWQLSSLSELGELARGKSKHRPRNDPKLFGGNHPFIQTGEVANSGGVIKSASNFYSNFGLSQSRLFPAGTLCITIAANIADTAILGIDACFPDSIVGFIPKPKSCVVQYAKYFIDANKSNLERFAPATAQKNINLKILNALELPFPSFEEQTEIVRCVEQLFAFADQIEQRVKYATARVNHLTQSILAKAFRGELTADWRAQNPDLISGENSAEALLERIRAEREANSTSGKKGRKRAAR